ncbi:CpaF family protein [Candidatus Viridilinea mediisalina]|uniref:Type II secretion system protein E n=1 Tax=Candidatus Viridilinea mediisalina TaxID=2024553 RepID=A0A2A6RFZ0_9CHLR|nr:CpaF family protein [Candidatus Viridilinea mediisalina]PDW01795.1 type II secretion system protein E [Candidatus Viridilinea mediisalina]
MSLLKRLGGGAPPPPKSEPAPKAEPPAPAPAAAPAAPPPAAAPSAAAPAASPKVEDGAQPTDHKRMLELSLWCVDRIQASLGNQTELTRSPETEKLLQERFARVYQQAGVNLGGDQVKQLFAMVCDELMGFGPIQQLLNDDSVSEVMVNGPNMIYVEQKGKLRLTEVRFANDEHVLKIIDRIIRPLGRRVDRKWPMVDARLPDGSRVNAIIPPCAIDGSTITIRKFSKNKLKIDDLVRFGSMTPEMAEFLRACVVSRLNIVVAGGTGSGKTTLLNVLSNFIPDDERIVTIEDSAELQLGQDHVVRLESKPAEIDGSGRVQIRDLVINSLRMRPERVVIGECRGGETLDMLQAMNTGHDGSLTTLHANTPRDALARMETMSMMAGMDLPLKVIREQIASAIDIIVQQSRLDDGQRKVTYITEVQGMEGELVVLQDIFKLDIKGKSAEGKIICELKPTGVRPKFNAKLEAHGFKLPPSIFGAQIPGQKKGW